MKEKVCACRVTEAGEREREVVENSILRNRATSSRTIEYERVGITLLVLAVG